MFFLNDDFMLYSDTAKELYHSFAENMPIIDYHCHLESKQIAENKNFKNLTELMLGGDHYKWRAMRSAGIEERFITGSADDRDKFIMWARALELCIGNPLYHWTHLELKRYFGIDKALTEENAGWVYDQCTQMLKDADFTPQRLIERSNVKALCTTDNPGDSLSYHRQLAQEWDKVKVLPAFRPDNILDISNSKFISNIQNMNVKSLSELKNKLIASIDHFHNNGCRLSDHGLGKVVFEIGNANEVFEKRLNGGKLSDREAAVYTTEMMLFLAKEYVKRGWVMQLHIGVLRDNNSVMLSKVGMGTGFDAISDDPIALPLVKLLDKMNTMGLPKTILYSINPKDNYTLATIIGNFQNSECCSKIQFGCAWWFNDNRDGMEDMLKALANSGVLGGFIGMLTDSRSFVSYTRHEYFRRILCNLIGGWVEKGEYPKNMSALEKIIKGICYNNAFNYFNF